MENSVNPTIVAVDDQPAILHGLVSILRNFYRVIPFSSGKSALKYLEENPADLIMLDYQMPEMTGIEVLEKLLANEITRKIPVIFLTGSEDGDTEVEVLERGAADYIVKPIKEQVLLTRVRMQLELSRYRERLESLVEEKTREIKNREEIALNLLARVTDMRDHETGGHITRTTEMVRVITDDLMNYGVDKYDLSPPEAEIIVESAKLHDLGKIAVPDMILLKPGKLDFDEFEIIKRHPTHGADMLEDGIEQMSEDSFLSTARDIALHHHEKWNGKGYPDGLAGEEIPLAARITAIADVYDALTSARPYKAPFSHEKAVEIITVESGSQFDPYLVSVFLKHEQKFKNIVLTTD